MQPQKTLRYPLDKRAPSARCDLWWLDTPTVDKHRVGLIGRFTAGDADSAAGLLERATGELREAGCTLAIGPMDGDSWHAYRATTRAGSEPAFALEPARDEATADWFRAAGFDLHSRYQSALMPIDGVRIPWRYRLLLPLLSRRYRLRQIDLDDFDAELERMHRFCLRAFAENHLYTPIELDDFRALYTPLRGYLRPEFVLIAEAAGEMAGLLFALPDLKQRERGETVDTLIFKTLAVAPEQRRRGLGFLLMYRGWCAARAAGYRRIIHAMMYRANRSRDFSSRNRVSVMREYGLFAKEL